jgi:hypothetical protein
MNRNATVFLLGVGVIAAHLLLAKMLWGFPWAGFVVGLSLTTFLAPGVGYIYIRSRRPAPAMRDAEIVEILDKPSLKRAYANHFARPAFEGDSESGGNAICKVCRLIRGPQPAIRILSPMAQNRCKKTQNKSRPQLPNRRF